MPSEHLLDDDTDWQPHEAKEAMRLADSIEQSIKRISEKCQALGIGANDMRYRRALFIADSHVSFLSEKGRVSGATGVKALQEIRRKILLHELSLDKEVPGTPESGIAFKNLSTHIREASTWMEPFISHLHMVDRRGVVKTS